ncbi:MAG: T9SS type A sorting domain-containing protein [Chitinophagales bacterium]|nr:T9SS type A sorting domain-containing protein [Chitinophagales bacterium]
MRKQHYTCLVFILIFTPTVLFSKVWYVNGSALGSATGADWPNAFPFLQQALSAAQAGDSVWVAQGVYYPTFTNNRLARFDVPSRVVLLGGFTGTESSAMQRDWVAYPAVLSGDIGLFGIQFDNSYNIMYLNFPEEGTLIDGFVFEDGAANIAVISDEFSSLQNGGAVFINANNGNGFPDFVHCVFRNNKAVLRGGAVFMTAGYNGSVATRFIDCKFYNNTAYEGGAVARYGGSMVERSPDFGNCFFENNRAVNGGGFHFDDSDGQDRMDILNTTFLNNRADASGGGFIIYADRGPAGSKTRIDNCVFDACKARMGAAFSDVSTTGFSGTFLLANTLIKNCIGTHVESTQTSVVDIELNSSSLVTGIPTNMQIQKCRFEKNYAVTNFIFIGLDNISINNCDFIDNVGFSESNSFSGNYTLISSEFTESKITRISNSTFTRNVLDVVFGGGNSMQIENCLFELNKLTMFNRLTHNSMITCFYNNCTFFENINKVITFSPSARYAKAQNCVFYHNYPEVLINFKTPFGQLQNCAIQTPCTGIPNDLCAQLLQISWFDFEAPYNFRPSSCSKLIDAGTLQGITPLANDLANQPRLAGNTIDIGAYEFQGSSAAIQFAGPPNILPPCNPAQLGAVYFNVQGACQELVYQWTNAATGATGTGNTDLPPGEYYFTITDDYTAQLLDTISLLANNGMQISADLTPADCGSAQGGSIAVSVQGGSAPYGYQWSHGGSGPVQQNLEPGFYTLTIADESNCKVTQLYEVGLYGTLSVALDSLPVSCADASDGYLAVQISGGHSPFIYQWADGVFTGIRDSLPPGIYSVSATDSYGCKGAIQAVLGAPQPLSESVVVQNASAMTASDGIISVFPSGGTAPYMLAWASGATQNPNFGLPPGAYAYTITDARGCTRTGAANVGVTVSAPVALAPSPVQLFPNPASHALTLLRPEAQRGEARLLLYDVAGRLHQSTVLPDGEGSTRIPVSALSPGLYYYQVQDALGHTLAAGKVGVLR